MQSTLINTLKSLHDKHEKLKHKVHTAWRYPLPKWGQYGMAFVYFCIPVFGGYGVMQWAIGKSHESIGEKGEKLKIKELQNIGDKTIINGTTQKVGAGGKLGGVHLAVSTQEDQTRNKQMLEAFFEKERKKRRKRMMAKESEVEQKDEDEGMKS